MTNYGKNKPKPTSTVTTERVEEVESVFETPEETEVVEVDKPLNKKIRERLGELEGQGKSVVYPTQESNWNQALLDRLNKL